MNDAHPLESDPENLASDADTPLNEERVQRVPRPGAMRPSKHSPSGHFAAEHQQKWLAIFGAIFCLLCALAAQVFTVNKLTQTKMVFATDGANTIHSGPLESLSAESNVMRVSTLLACQAAFQRSVRDQSNGGPENSRGGADFDLPELVDGLFRADAKHQLQEDLRKQQSDIATRHLSQKVEVGDIRGLSQAKGTTLVRASGDLKRSGSFEGKPISESVPFKVLFAFRENPRLDQRGQYPFIVTDFFSQIGAASQDDDTAAQAAQSADSPANP